MSKSCCSSRFACLLKTTPLATKAHPRRMEEIQSRLSCAALVFVDGVARPTGTIGRVESVVLALLGTETGGVSFR